MFWNEHTFLLKTILGALLLSAYLIYVPQLLLFISPWFNVLTLEVLKKKT